MCITMVVKLVLPLLQTAVILLVLTDIYDNIISEEVNLFVSLNDYQEFKAYFEKGM